VGTVTMNGTPHTYSYDANGNMTSGPDLTDPAQVRTRTITYNGDNMPAQITVDGNTVDFVYDGSGVRAKKTVNQTNATYYIGKYYEKRNGVVTKYVFAGNTRIAKIKGTDVFYFHKDHLGSSTLLTNASGTVVETTEYMPFGGDKTRSGALEANYKYTDQEYDLETGLYNYRARLYDPIIATFITPDSIVPHPSDPQMLNRYAYCRNNPIKYVDPTGRVLVIANRPAEGLMGELGFNHAYLYDTDTGRTLGLDSTCGSGADGAYKPEDYSSHAFNVIDLPKGLSANDVMDHFSTHRNDGLWPFPDCHGSIQRSLDHFGIENPGAPGGRWGDIPSDSTKYHHIVHDLYEEDFYSDTGIFQTSSSSSTTSSSNQVDSWTWSDQGDSSFSFTLNNPITPIEDDGQAAITPHGILYTDLLATRNSYDNYDFANSHNPQNGHFQAQEPWYVQDPNPWYALQ